MTSLPPTRPPSLELLAPAKNLEFGLEALQHGADAVYIGGPAFGARAGAGNPITDIERLASQAHRFNARVLVALNTLLHDRELEEARRMAWQAYEAGADALIVQDMGLLQLDLPPLELHASTQADIRTAEKARFLEDAGFSQMVLARELSLDQIRRIAEQTTATLEFFVHGALCVAYSGLCNLSYATTGRSANRGECSQPCRLPYTLTAPDGKIIAENRHLLSLKDNDQHANLGALIEAGIRSFKIEGRLKDLAYVKNITAYYRQKIDALIDDRPELARSSSGSSRFLFAPQPEKTFNRGATDYFVHCRQSDIGAFATPKFVGEAMGKVTRILRNGFEIRTTKAMHNGDGLTYFNSRHELVGMRINLAVRIESGYRLTPSLSDGGLPEGLRCETKIYRNHDQEFLRLLEKKSAERRIPIDLCFGESADGFTLHAGDERGITAQAHCQIHKQTAQDPEKARRSLRDNLEKLGGTIYCVKTLELPQYTPWFIPASTLNALRRAVIDALDSARIAAYRRPGRRAMIEPPAIYPEPVLNHLGNVTNDKAREFYRKHGVSHCEAAYECTAHSGDSALMITKHCLRYSFGLCPKQAQGTRPDPLSLTHGQDTFTLRFDCRVCEMQVIGRRKKGATSATNSRIKPARS